MKKMIAIMALCSGIVNAAQLIEKQHIISKHELGDINVLSKDCQFAIEQMGKLHMVDDRDISSTLRRITAQKCLVQFLKNNNKLVVTRLRDEQGQESFAIKEHVHGPGGGPGLAAFCYWAVKGGLWGTAAAVGITAAAATGGAAGAGIMGAATAFIPVAGPVGMAAAGAAGAAVSAAPALLAAANTGLAVGAATSVGLVGGIEALAVTASIACGFVPTP